MRNYMKSFIDIDALHIKYYKKLMSLKWVTSQALGQPTGFKTQPILSWDWVKLKSIRLVRAGLFDDP